MKIIFLGTTGIHHTVIAANAHLKFPLDKPFYNPEEFGNLELEATGFPIYIGEDNNGNQIYSLGAGRDIAMAKKTIEDLTTILGYPDDLLVKPVSVRGEQLFAIIKSIPVALGGRLWNKLIPAIILKSQLKAIYQALE
jgi:hypothetical protein